MGYAKKLMARLLTAAMLFGTASITVPAPICAEIASYTDVENHWAQSSIERWSDYEIVNGNEIGQFLPDANMTRGQLAKVLATLLGLTEIPADNPFSDVPDDEWYAPFMLRCYEAGIILGSEGMGMPEASISRQESMVMIARALGIEPMDVAELSDFSDASGVESWAAGYVAALISKGIVSGIADNILAPAETINRASVMTVLDRSIGQYINSGGVYELVENAGIVLVVSGDVMLTGSTDANLIVSPACAGKAVAFDGAVVTGTITVQTDSCAISEKNSNLHEIKIIGTEFVAGDAEKTEEATGTAGGGSGAAGGGGGFTPSPTPVQTPNIAEKLETLGFYYEAADSKATSIIKPQVVDGKAYLFLPSSADYSSIYFTANDTTELYGTVQGTALTTTANNSEKLDLTAIFGTMNPGTQYPMKAKCGTTECEIILMKGANIPSLYITLDESKLPSGYDSSLSYIHEDKSNKLPGNLVMIGADGSVVEEALKQLKGRGNSTWAASVSGECRPYNITLDKKKVLIEGDGSAKKWCLLRTQKADILSNMIGFNIFSAMNGDSALSLQPIDLYIDNEYRGLYLISEKVEINENRVNITEAKMNDGERTITVTAASDPSDAAILEGIDSYGYVEDSVVKKSGGFLVEKNHVADELCWFKTKRGEYFTLKEPEAATKEQVQQIAMYFQHAEDALFSQTGYNSVGKHYTEYMDVDSFAKLYLLECFVLQQDMMFSSAYYYVDVDSNGEINTTIKSGPAWDYNGLISRNGDEGLLPWYGAKEGCAKWCKALLNKADFVKSLYVKNNSPEFRNIARSAIGSDIQTYIEEIFDSAQLHSIRWNYDFMGPVNGVDFRSANWHLVKMQERYERWYNEIWTQDKLLGATATYDGTKVQVDVNGTASEYQWYRVNPSDHSDAILIEGATESFYVPNENGLYFCGVKGGNFAYDSWEFADPMLKAETLTMYTNPVLVI